MTFENKFTNFRDYYLTEKGPTNSGMGTPNLPSIWAMPQSKRSSSVDGFSSIERQKTAPRLGATQVAKKQGARIEIPKNPSLNLKSEA